MAYYYSMNFNPATVAQMSAFFTNKQGKSIYVLKLMKLLYLADRLSIDKYREPISWDLMVSMDHGPVLSRTLNFIDGNYPPSEAQGWKDWMQDRSGLEISSSKSVSSSDEFDRLSNADVEILEQVWREFGHMDKWALVKYTHENCPEWTDPNGSSIPFDYVDVLRGVGKTSKEVRDLHHKMREQRELDQMLS